MPGTNSREWTVLFMPEGSVLAHVGRALAMASALRSDEVSVCFAVSGQHARWITEREREVLPVHTLPRSELLARLRRGGSAFDEAQLRRYVEDELRVLSEVRPDVVIGDFRPSLGISARYLDIPYVCVTNAVWTKYCGFSVDPPDSWLPTRVLGKRLLRRLRPVLEKRVFAHYAVPFNRVRRLYGLSALEDIRDCMCSEDLNLLADVPEFCPTVGLPSNFRYIGPVLWEPAVPDPAWLEELDPSCKTVYVTMGSTGPLEEIRGIASKLLDMGLQVVCTTATEGVESSPGQPGFYAARYAPGGKLCELADVVVCHAGNGTTYQALSHGSPLVGIPEFHDQEFNMQRVEALGLGCRVRRGPGVAEEVPAAVNTVLADQQYRQRARAFQRILGQTNAPAEAAKAVRQFLGAASVGVVAAGVS